MPAEPLNRGNESAAVSDEQGMLILPEPVPASPVKERRHAAFFDVVGASLKVHTPEQFCAWAQDDLQKIFPHGMLACGIGLIENPGGRVQQMITCNLPHDYLRALQQEAGVVASPLMTLWAKTRRPVLFELSAQRNPSVWQENFERHGMHNMAAHGQCDLRSCTTSYFCFANLPGKLTPRHADLLEMLVPHLHAALIRALNGVNQAAPSPAPASNVLTVREQEILQWLGAGKTNWEIAQVLKISENTVKNHVQRILNKLKVKSRAQAVAKDIARNNASTQLA